MLFFSASALLALLAQSAEATIAITRNTGGYNATTGARPDRLEINGFASQGGPAWDLYVQCLADVQSRPQTQIDSFYQIAGIHGRPYIAWDGVQSAPGSHSGGYCPHSSVLFPTWHRPYLALLEQTIWSCAQSLAATYPTSTRSSYVNAAVTLRIPYWDWVKTATLPTVVTQSTITITKPAGKATIDNPLYSYKFHPHPSSSDFPGSAAPQSYSQSVRSPDSKGNSNHAAVNQALQQNAGYLHDTSYLILTRDENYAEFSNNGYAGTMQGYGSIENPHGSVHNCVGGNGGHMTYLDYSAFDPIFWLHHANVDRLFAIWQALHPNSWTINQEDDAGTYSISAGTVETATTPLGPFHRDTSGTLWTSSPARGTKEFGYTYPEVRPWGKTAADNTAYTKAAIRALYDPNGSLGRRSKMSTRSQLDTRATPPLNPAPAIVDGSYKQWALNLRVNKFALASSFIVHVFIGSPSSDSSSWATDPNLVASYPVLRATGTMPAQNLTIYGTVPLTRALLAAVDSKRLANTEVDSADPYLRKNLNWRVADPSGMEIQIEDIPSLKVFVVDQEVTPPQGATDFPKYGKITPHRDITTGKPGGLLDSDGY